MHFQTWSDKAGNAPPLTAVDPVTGGLWTSGEYGKTTSSWGTWVGYFPWTPTGSFTDIQANPFFADYINVLATWQVTLGCTATQYCPTDPVSRGQLAAFIIRSLYGDNFTYTTTPYFTDVPAQVQSHGITSPEGLVDFYLALLVDSDVTPEARQALVDYLNASGPMALDDSGALDLKARGLVHLALATPSYQLA